MALNSDRISWVGNLCQKFETICQEVNGIGVQEKAKYIESQVQTGCDSVRKFCAGFMQDFLVPARSALGEYVSDFSLMFDVDYEMSEESEAESLTEEKTLAPTELDESVSLEKGSSPGILPSEPYDDSNQGACGELIKDLDPISDEVTGCNYPEMEEDIYSNHSDACFAASSAYSFASVPVTDVTERLNDSEWGETSMSIDLTETKIEEEEEFESVKLENFLDLEAERNETKKRSYKKLLGNVFASKMKSAKKQGHKKLEIQSLIVNVETKKNEEISISFVPEVDLISNKMLSNVICESEWELL